MRLEKIVNSTKSVKNSLNLLPRPSWSANWTTAAEMQRKHQPAIQVEDDLQDSFTLSDTVRDEDDHFWANKKVRFSTPKELTPTLDSPQYSSTGSRQLHTLEEEEEEEPDQQSQNVHATLVGYDEGPKFSCTECLCHVPRRLRSAQQHRKCPHSFRILLIFVMFVLLGFVERGCFAVLFYILNTHFHLQPGEAATLYFTTKFFIYVCYPITGFLADTFYGHHRVIRVFLCVAWIGCAFMSLAFSFSKVVPSSLLHACDTSGVCWPVLVRVFTGVGYTILGLGLTGIRVNLIPFGADQLPDASGGELSSYFHWHYFCISLGHFVAVVCLPLLIRFGTFSYVFLALTTALTLILAIFLVFQTQWIILPKRGNPLKLVYNVVRSALSTRRPVKISAFDVGRPRPLWIDKAMIKYGGSYTLEQVEAVKTFFRILVIVMTCIGYYAVFSQVRMCSLYLV